MEGVTGWDFWRFCFRLGWRESIRGIDYFRFYEYPAFYRDMQPGRLGNVLDLGCGRGLFPLFCASRNPGLRYVTVDIDPEAVRWQERMKRRLRGLPNFEPRIGDSTRIDLPDESFDCVANLGSVEHIPGEGDIRTAREMGRVCRPGGKLIFSIPYSFVGEENPTTDHWAGFERRYDDDMVEERLIRPSGCTLVSKTYFGEPGFSFSRYWYRIPFLLKLPLRHLAAPASRWWIREFPEEDRRSACGIRFVLQKEE